MEVALMGCRLDENRWELTSHLWIISCSPLPRTKLLGDCLIPVLLVPKNLHLQPEQVSGRVASERVTLQDMGLLWPFLLLLKFRQGYVDQDLDFGFSPNTPH